MSFAHQLKKKTHLGTGILTAGLLRSPVKAATALTRQKRMESFIFTDIIAGRYKEEVQGEIHDVRKYQKKGKHAKYTDRQEPTE